jgi:hypothetical protein
MEEVRGLVKALTKAEAPEAIADVLRALAKAPVTVPILHELKCGAVVSKLRKHENESVATEAKLLIKQWKGLAAAAGVPQTKAPAPPPQKTHSFAVDDLGDPTRQAARKKLQATLGEDASDADSYPAAEAVELALHRKWPNLQQPDQKRDYVAKLRQLSFNLKKNSELRSDVNSRKLTPEKLLELDADQLATKDKQEAVWKSTSASGASDNSSLSQFSAMTRPSWLGRAARNRHRHAIEQASRRWRGGRAMIQRERAVKF